MGKEAIVEWTERNPTQRVDVVLRFPRLAENDEEKLKAERAELETEAFAIIANFRKLRVELGRVFIRIKATLKHGQWQRYYAKTFGTSSVPLRSAERYMKRARKADALSKNDRLTVFKPGTTPEARERQSATVEAQAEIGDVPKPEPVYRLALHLSADKRDATIRLWQSPHRRRAERKIVAVLDQLLIKFGVLKDKGIDDEKGAR